MWRHLGRQGMLILDCRSSTDSYEHGQVDRRITTSILAVLYNGFLNSRLVNFHDTMATAYKYELCFNDVRNLYIFKRWISHRQEVGKPRESWRIIINFLRVIHLDINICYNRLTIFYISKTMSLYYNWVLIIKYNLTGNMQFVWSLINWNQLWNSTLLSTYLYQHRQNSDNLCPVKYYKRPK